VKKLTCAAIISNGKKVLIVRNTGVKDKKYDFPKGLKEALENELDAVVREVKEETSLVLDRENLKELGKTTYLKEKDIIFFYYQIKNLPDTNMLKCTSYFTDSNLCSRPEVDDFKIVEIKDLSKYLRGNMIKALRNLNIFEGFL
jgi:8-oxo-dGTP pyrophosphatase MutT (NUDIX family)